MLAPYVGTLPIHSEQVTLGLWLLYVSKSSCLAATSIVFCLQTVFLPEDNLVVGPIDVPCSGTTIWGGTFNGTNACDTNEIYGWAQYAEQYAVNNLGVTNLAYYKRRIMILPDVRACGWAGLGSLGCGSACYTWIQVGWWLVGAVFFSVVR